MNFHIKDTGGQASRNDCRELGNVTKKKKGRAVKLST